MKQGRKITKLHTVYQFRQSPLLRNYVRNILDQKSQRENQIRIFSTN